MNPGASDHLSSTGMALDVILIAVAIPFIVWPEIRSPAMKTIVWTVFILHGGLSIYFEWKTGMLTKTPAQIYETLRRTGALKHRRFERLAFFLGIVAFAIAAWW
jgi:hypothetical protein